MSRRSRRVRRQTDEAIREATEFIDDNPVVSALTALVAGALATSAFKMYVSSPGAAAAPSAATPAKKKKAGKKKAKKKAAKKKTTKKKAAKKKASKKKSAQKKKKTAKRN